MPRIQHKSSVKRVKPDEHVVPVLEHFELLISDIYELTRPVPVHVYRYDNGTVLIRSMELNLFAQGDREYDTRLAFSEILIEELENLESDIKKGRKLGKALLLELNMLRRLLGKIEK